MLANRSIKFGSKKTSPLVAELGRLREMLPEGGWGGPPSERLRMAQSFCYSALAGWWQAMEKQADIAHCPALLDALPGEVEARARHLGSMLFEYPRDTAAYLLSTLYAGLLPDDQRSAEGVFYTPPLLVERLLTLVEQERVNWETDRVIDPAAGSGAFLTAVAERMSTALASRGATADEIITHVAGHLSGVEIDPFAAWMSHVFLEASLWHVCAPAGRRLPELVRVQDALALPDNWGGGFDVIVGNPPYARVTLDGPTRARFARSLFGHANLYGVFTDLAVRLCRPGGRIALVTPASFLGGQYFKRLRGMLLHAAPPVAIDFVTSRSRVFDDVLQETVLVVFAPSPTPRRVIVRVTRPSAVGSTERVTEVGRVELAPDSEVPWVLPRTAADADLLQRVQAMPHRLVDYGLSVSTGPLVWNRHKDQLRSRLGRGCYPLIWAESVLPDGRFEFRSRRRNHEPYFEPRATQAGLVLRNPAILLQRTTAKEQSRRLIAAVLPQSFLDEFGGAVVENHVNVVRPSGVRARVPLEAVAALLNSHIVDTIFRCTSGTVAVSAYELESIPVPPPEVMHQLHALLLGGSAPAVIESFIRRSYGELAEAAA